MKVDVANDDLDDTTELITDTLYTASGKDRGAALYRRYLKNKAPSDIIRMGLENQLPVVRPWVASLRSEAHPGLPPLGDRLELNVEVGTLAVVAREDAAAASADYRVREVYGFIDAVNAARQSVYGTLCQRAAERGLGRDWPHRFFRRGTLTSPRAREKKAGSTATPGTGAAPA